MPVAECAGENAAASAPGSAARRASSNIAASHLNTSPWLGPRCGRRSHRASSARTRFAARNATSGNVPPAAGSLWPTDGAVSAAEESFSVFAFPELASSEAASEDDAASEPVSSKVTPSAAAGRALRLSLPRSNWRRNAISCSSSSSSACRRPPSRRGCNTSLRGAFSVLAAARCAARCGSAWPARLWIQFMLTGACATRSTVTFSTSATAPMAMNAIAVSTRYDTYSPLANRRRYRHGLFPVAPSRASPSRRASSVGAGCGAVAAAAADGRRAPSALDIPFRASCTAARGASARVRSIRGWVFNSRSRPREFSSEPRNASLRNERGGFKTDAYGVVVLKICESVVFCNAENDARATMSRTTRLSLRSPCHASPPSA